MTSATTLSSAAGQLLELPERLFQIQAFADAVASLQAGHAATIDGAWGSACALVAAALAQKAPGPLVVVCPQPDDSDAFQNDLPIFTQAPVAAFPAWETFAAERVIHDELFGDRLRLLKRLAAGDDLPAIIVTSIQGLLQPSPARSLLARRTRRLSVGEEVEIDALLAWLASQGFQSVSAVELPGEFSRRGGILDLFAADWSNPVRVELFGDEVESLRRFDVASQRSLESLPAIDVTVLDAAFDECELMSDYLPADAWFALLEPAELDEQGRQYLRRLDQPEKFHTVKAVLQAAYRFPSVTVERIASGSLDLSCHLPIESIERFSGDIGRVRQELDSVAAGQRMFVVCQTEAEAQRLEEIFRDSRLAASGALAFPVGHLRAGFRLVSEGVALVSGGELFQRSDVARRSVRQLGRVIDSFLELREGDLVVHVAHGIARYLGLRLLEKGDQIEEHMELEFHGGTKVYVPASKIELVQKYVGGTKARPPLARIGGKSWARHKRLAENAVIDLASDLLELQATRTSRPGIAFQTRSDWQRAFEAAFPYNDTADQATATQAIQRDMAKPRPMDRLVCGDVGYGKTELAMRAAFAAVDSGYQVAVLVPTTVLAEQHYRTFAGRMAEYPFEISKLSRFCTKKEQREILERAESGAVDVIIGTHRLAQKDVAFHNLGLVIIDEEQRFGVDVKERLKHLRRTVDVLTLTATPIPRTLHMSLLGLRDISNLETPPEDRQAVETRVTRFEPELIRHAVLRELNRGGQIFFVHNRIEDIEAVHQRLKQIVPEASVAIGHGQMAEGELERVMLGFINRQHDILLSTTIIESGLDIPNANTIFIDEADRYGLADLHQLRGRVGRYKHRAYCYLLVDPLKALTPSAARRLRAIEEFSSMGAGFAIAMRNLEIRGAGNILGSEQSGHINAVGYELYCELLERAVRKLKHMSPKERVDVNLDLPGQAFLPRSYVPDMRLKIDLYRRLARVASEAELTDFQAELADRFGPPPEEAQRLIRVMLIRLLAQRWSIHSMHLEDAYVVCGYHLRTQAERLEQLSKKRLRVVDSRSAYVTLKVDPHDADGILQQLESLLRAE